MKIRLRLNAFETNSSSTHALHISQKDQLDQWVSQEEIRSGIVDVSYSLLEKLPADWVLIRSVKGKLAYLLTHAYDRRYASKTEDIERNENYEFDLLPHCQANETYKRIQTYIKKLTGCELRFFDSSFDVYQSGSAKGILSVTEDIETFKRFIFSSQSHIKLDSRDGMEFKTIEDDEGNDVLSLPQAYVHREFPRLFRYHQTLAQKTWEFDDQSVTVDIQFANPPFFYTDEQPFNAHVLSFTLGDPTFGDVSEPSTWPEDALNDFMYAQCGEKPLRTISVDPNYVPSEFKSGGYGDWWEREFSIELSCDNETYAAVREQVLLREDGPS